MQRITAISLLVALTASPAFAGGPADHGGHRPPAPQVSTSGAAASSVARGGTATSSATGGAGGSARATGGNGYGGVGYGGSTSVTVQGGGGNGNNAGTGPAIFLPSLAGNASCGGSISLGGIGPAAGASGGGMWEFFQCKAVREANMLQQLGRPDLALALMCQQIDRVKEAMGGSCDAPVPQTVASKPDYCWTASAGEVKQHRECR
jgi:hypothetical protein